MRLVEFNQRIVESPKQVAAALRRARQGQWHPADLDSDQSGIVNPGKTGPRQDYNTGLLFPDRESEYQQQYNQQMLARLSPGQGRNYRLIDVATVTPQTAKNPKTNKTENTGGVSVELNRNQFPELNKGGLYVYSHPDFGIFYTGIATGKKDNQADVSNLGQRVDSHISKILDRSGTKGAPPQNWFRFSRALRQIEGDDLEDANRILRDIVFSYYPLSSPQQYYNYYQQHPDKLSGLARKYLQSNDVDQEDKELLKGITSDNLDDQAVKKLSQLKFKKDVEKIETIAIKNINSFINKEYDPARASATNTTAAAASLYKDIEPGEKHRRFTAGNTHKGERLPFGSNTDVDAFKKIKNYDPTKINVASHQSSPLHTTNAQIELPLGTRDKSTAKKVPNAAAASRSSGDRDSKFQAADTKDQPILTYLHDVSTIESPAKSKTVQWVLKNFISREPNKSLKSATENLLSSSAPSDPKYQQYQQLIKDSYRVSQIAPGTEAYNKSVDRIVTTALDLMGQDLQHVRSEVQGPLQSLISRKQKTK